MAKFEKSGTGNFNQVLETLHKTIMAGSLSVSLEESSNFNHLNTRVAVRVYERYSYAGGNRLSLSLFLVDAEERLYLNLITAGGSRAIFFKVNRIGENKFLNTVKSVADRLIK